MSERLRPFRKHLLLPISIIFSLVMTLGSVVSVLEGSMSVNRYIPLLAVIGSWCSLFFAVSGKATIKLGYILLASSVALVMFVFPFLGDDPHSAFIGFLPLIFSLNMILIVLSGLFGVPVLVLCVALQFYAQFFALSQMPLLGILDANYAFLIIAVALVSFLAIRYHFLVSNMIAELLDALETNKQLSELSVTDPLTGLYNRRHIEFMLSSECERVRRYGGSLSCLMLDVDHFKRFNDTYGHQNGDEVLQKVAEAMLKTSRKSDMCGRYGGEEFLILSPVDIEHAELFGERLRKIIDALRFEFSGEDAAVTMSIGISEFGENCSSERELVRTADDALYRAKVSGRDQTVIHG